MMYSTVFMYGLDGRLSPLSYNRVCRVGNLLEDLASSPWVYPNAIFVVSPGGLGDVTGISIHLCRSLCCSALKLKISSYLRAFSPLRNNENSNSKKFNSRIFTSPSARRQQLLFSHLVVFFFFRIEGSILSSVSGIYRWLWCNVFKNMAGPSNLYQHHESEEGTVLHFVAPVL